MRPGIPRAVIYPEHQDFFDAVRDWKLGPVKKLIADYPSLLDTFLLAGMADLTAILLAASAGNLEILEHVLRKTTRTIAAKEFNEAIGSVRQNLSQDRNTMILLLKLYEVFNSSSLRNDHAQAILAITSLVNQSLGDPNPRLSKIVLTHILERCSGDIKWQILLGLKNKINKPYASNLPENILQAANENHLRLTAELLEYTLQVIHPSELRWAVLPNGNNAVHCTAIKNNPVLFEKLVKSGAPAAAKNVDGKTPLDLVLEQNPPLTFHQKKKFIDILKQYDVRDTHVRSHLFNAISAGDLLLATLLADYANDCEIIRDPSATGELFVHRAITSRNPSMLEMLLRSGATAPDSCISMIMADDYPIATKIQMLKKLIAEKRTPKYFYMRYSILKAAQSNDIELMTTLLEYGSASQTPDELFKFSCIAAGDGDYAVHWAIKNNNPAMLRLLLQYKAKARQRQRRYSDQSGMTPFELLFKCNFSSDVVISFLQIFKDFKIKANAKVMGNAVTAAAEKNDVPLLKALLEYAAYIGERLSLPHPHWYTITPSTADGTYGSYPLHLAVTHKNLPMLRLLVQYGYALPTVTGLKNAVDQTTPLGMLPVDADRQFKIEVLKIFKPYKMNFSYLGAATFGDHLYKAVATKDDELIKILVEYANFCTMTPEWVADKTNGNNVFHLAIINKNSNLIELFVNLKFSNIHDVWDKKNVLGYSAIDLMLNGDFAVQDKINFVKSLQKNNINCSNVSLHIAVSVKNNHSQLTEVLLDYQFHLQKSQLRSVIAADDLVQVQHFLTRPLMTTSLDNKGNTALMFAAQGKGNIDTVRYLLRCGANTQAKNQDGMCAADLTTNPAIKAIILESQNYNMSFDDSMVQLVKKCNVLAQGAFQNHVRLVLGIVIKCVDLKKLDTLDAAKKIDLYCTLKSIVTIVEETKDLEQFQKRMKEFFATREEAIFETPLDYGDADSDFWSNSICYQIAQLFCRDRKEYEADVARYQIELKAYQPQLKAYLEFEQYQQAKQAYWEKADKDAKFAAANPPPPARAFTPYPKRPSQPVRSDRPYDILMAKAKTARRIKPWSNLSTGEEQLPVVTDEKAMETPGFFRTSDRLLHVTLEVVEQAFARLKSSETSKAKIWVATDAYPKLVDQETVGEKGVKQITKVAAESKREALSDSALQTLRQASPSLAALIDYTVKLSDAVAKDAMKSAALKSVTSEINFLKAFTDFREKIRAGDAHGYTLALKDARPEDAKIERNFFYVYKVKQKFEYAAQKRDEKGIFRIERKELAEVLPHTLQPFQLTEATNTLLASVAVKHGYRLNAGSQLHAADSFYIALGHFIHGFWLKLPPELQQKIGSLGAQIWVDEHGMGVMELKHKTIGDVLKILTDNDEKDDRKRSATKFCIGTQGEKLEKILSDSEVKKALLAMSESTVKHVQITDNTLLDAWHQQIRKELSAPRRSGVVKPSYLNDPKYQPVIRAVKNMGALDHGILTSLNSKQSEVQDLLRRVGQSKYEDTQTLLQFIFKQKDNGWLLELHNRLQDQSFHYLRNHNFLSRHYACIDDKRVSTSKSWATIERALAQQMVKNVVSNNGDVQSLVAEHKFISNHRKLGPHLKSNTAAIKMGLTVTEEARNAIQKSDVPYQLKIERLIANDITRVRAEIVIEANSFFSSNNENIELQALENLCVRIPALKSHQLVVALINLKPKVGEKTAAHLRECLNLIPAKDQRVALRNLKKFLNENWDARETLASQFNYANFAESKYALFNKLKTIRRQLNTVDITSVGAAEIHLMYLQANVQALLPIVAKAQKAKVALSCAAQARQEGIADDPNGPMLLPGF